MKNLSKREKYDIGLVPQALNNTNITGRYISMQLYRKALALLLAGAMAAATTTKIEILQAQDELGTNAKGIPDTPTQAATATITANTNVNAATLTLTTVVATNVVTINGITFTFVASGAIGNQVNVGGNDTISATNLAAVINAANIGVTATPSATVVTLTATNVEGKTITITAPSGTIVAATTQASAYVEVDPAYMDVANGFLYLGVKVTTTANTNISATFIRADGRYVPVQAVGAFSVAEA